MDWKALIDKTLGTHFNAPVYDPAKGRDKLVKVIDKAAEQHKEGKTPPTRSWKLGSNRAISFAPVLNGNPVLLQGEAVSYVPAERFQDFLSGLKAAVQAGDLDDEIKAALDGESSSGTRGGKPRAAATGPSRQSKMEARADGLPHRVPASEPQPHGDYTLNTGKTHWRSPEQVAKDAASYAGRSGKKA